MGDDRHVADVVARAHGAAFRAEREEESVYRDTEIQSPNWSPTEGRKRRERGDPADFGIVGR